MSAIGYEGVAYSRSAATAFVGELAWALFLLPLILFSWHQSQFQYDVYAGEAGAIAVALSLAGVACLAAIAWPRAYPRSLVRIACAYALLAALHGILDQIITSDRHGVLFAQAMLFAMVLLPIIADASLLRRFVRMNFLLGITLCALNTVTVLYWLNIVDLPNRQVPRFGGELGLFELDPLHFGIFGLTENYPYPGEPLGVARLQGFSLEPIHWAYFVFLTLACGLFLLPGSSRRARIGLYFSFALIAVHLFFIFSTVALIAVVIWAAVVGVLYLIRRRRGAVQRETLYGMLAAVLTPGLLIPFVISRIPNLDLYLVAENALNKGSNWDSKIGFLSLGSALYTRIFPTLGDPPSAGQNLILVTYLKYGYFLTLPLLFFLWAVLKRAFAGMPFPIMAGTAMVVVMHTIVVPPALFYPTGAMLILLSVGVAYHVRAPEVARG